MDKLGVNHLGLGRRIYIRTKYKSLCVVSLFFRQILCVQFLVVLRVCVFVIFIGILDQFSTNVNLSSSPFQYAASRYINNYTVFYCESEPIYYSITPLPTCLNASGQILYAVSFSSPLENMVSCNHLYDLLSIPSEILWRNTQLSLSWSKPKCSVCEAKGKRCRLRSNTTGLITECYGAPISGRVYFLYSG